MSHGARSVGMLRRRRESEPEPWRRQALDCRGHEVDFWGRPEMVGRVQAAGLSASEQAEARTDLDRYSVHPMATVFG